MKIEKDILQSGDQYSIRRYGEGHLQINADVITSSCILTRDQLSTEWPPERFEQLDTKHLDALLATEPEVILIGTGRETRLPSPAMMGHVMRLGVGLECMDTGAACRTFNILVGEERRVAAGLFMIEAETN